MAFFNGTRNMRLIFLLLVLLKQTDQSAFIRIEEMKNYNCTSLDGFFCRDRLVSCSSRLKGQGTPVPFTMYEHITPRTKNMTNHRLSLTKICLIYQEQAQYIIH